MSVTKLGAVGDYYKHPVKDEFYSPISPLHQVRGNVINLKYVNHVPQEKVVDVGNSLKVHIVFQ